MIGRRQFLAGAAAVGVSAAPRKRRTMYFNDARHFYLYSFDPPMSDEDSWRPVDELLGTAVNTLIYGVETGGLFSRTKVAVRAFSESRPYTSALAWRAWYNMQSLIDRGLDPLRVVIDRAHDKGLDFIVSMRMGGGPKGSNTDFSQKPTRDLRFSWLQELASYPVEGVELDFAYIPNYFPPGEARQHAATMTQYVREISAMIRAKGNGRIVGARVFPSVALNRSLGLDVDEWISKRYIDYAAPMFYGFHQLDPNLPFETLVTAARGTGAEIYPVIQPFYLRKEEHATPGMLRAAVANYWAKGADGLIVAPWFRWPLRDAEKSFLTDIGDPAAVRDRDKHYIVAHREPDAAKLGYDQPLPAVIGQAGPSARAAIPFYVSDDCASRRVRSVRLLLKVNNLVGQDSLMVRLNGSSLEAEPVRRTSHRYEFHWLDYSLTRIRPRRGENTLEVALPRRPEGLEGGITVEQVELALEYALPGSVFERPRPL